MTIFKIDKEIGGGRVSWPWKSMVKGDVFRIEDPLTQILGRPSVYSYAKASCRVFKTWVEFPEDFETKRVLFVECLG